MIRFLIVCGAGAAGCGARYLVAIAVGPRPFPYATLIVNLIGSFLMALAMEVSLRVASGVSPNLRLALTTGFMGGLTTYSSFNFETTTLATQHAWLRVVLNVGATLIGCMLAGLAGLWVARRLT